MAAAFKRVTRAEVPTEWAEAARKPVPEWIARDLGFPNDTPMDKEVCLELPDFTIAYDWQKWYQQHPDQNDCVGVIITPRDEWKNRRQALENTLRELINEGRPALIWNIAYFPSSPTTPASSR